MLGGKYKEAQLWQTFEDEQKRVYDQYAAAGANGGFVAEQVVLF